MTDLQEAQRIYVAACHLPPEERAALVAAECGEDAALRATVERLLAHFDAPVADLDRPTFVARGAASADGGSSLHETLARRVGEMLGDASRGDDEDEAARRLQALAAPPDRPRYEIVREIGRGGMGAVFEVIDGALDRRLALKVIARGFGGATPGAAAISPSLVLRFLDEAKVTAQLDHPGIVPVHEVGLDDDGRLYYTMPLVRGRNLADVFRAAGDPDDPEWTVFRAVGVLRSVCEAMAYAHSRGVVHRDLKPANVMVGPFGEVFVMDWGLAKVLSDAARDGAAGTDDAPSDGSGSGSSRTLHGQVLGTPGYLAPEQAAGDPARLGPPADVYAVGAMLYHLLAGHAPFADPTSRDRETSALERVVNGEAPPPLDRVADRAPPELVAICEHAMAADPARRYADMRALADDLRAWLEGRVVRAHERGPIAELRKWVRRNRLLASSLAAAVVLLVAAPTVVMLREARSARELARKNEQVTREAETSRRVTRFLVGMLESEDPRRALGREVTVREVIDREAPRVLADLREDPILRARLLGTMGSVYLSLGLAGAAEPLLETALRVRAEELGEEHPETLVALRDVGTLRIEQGRLEEARSAIETSLRGLSAALGDDHEETLRARTERARVANDSGDPETAEALLEEVAADRAASLGPRHPATLKARANLAVALDGLGRTDQAVRVMEEIVRASREELGDDHPDTLTARQSLAAGLVALDRLDEAEEEFDAAIEGRRRVLGDDHPDTLVSIASRAGVSTARGRFDRAEEAYRALREPVRRRFGEDHPFTWATESNLGDALLKARRLDEAEPVLIAALAGRRRVLGDDHPNTLDTLSNLAQLRAAQGRLGEAEELHRETLDGYRRGFGEDHPDTLASMNNLALVLLREGRAEEAEPIFREVLARQSRVLGEDHRMTLGTTGNLAEVVLRLGRTDEAESLLRRALEGRRRLLGEDHPETLGSISRLAMAEWKAGRLESAERLCAELLERGRRVFGPDHPGTIEAIRSLSRVLWSADRVEDAIARHREAIAEAERALGATHPTTLTYVADLAFELHRRGRNDEAEPLAARAAAGTPADSPLAAKRNDLLLRIRSGAQ